MGKHVMKIFPKSAIKEKISHFPVVATDYCPTIFCVFRFKMKVYQFNFIGMWIRAHPGRTTSRYRKSDDFKTTSLYYETCTKDQCEMLDKLVTPFWLRRRHYPEDPYESYHVRHGINSPRVDEKGHLVRERPKILMDDLTAGKYFDDR